jgi:hypothetical protein
MTSWQALNRDLFEEVVVHCDYIVHFILTSSKRVREQIEYTVPVDFQWDVV